MTSNYYTNTFARETPSDHYNMVHHPKTSSYIRPKYSSLIDDSDMD